MVFESFSSGSEENFSSLSALVFDHNELDGKIVLLFDSVEVFSSLLFDAEFAEFETTSVLDAFITRSVSFSPKINSFLFEFVDDACKFDL